MIKDYLNNAGDYIYLGPFISNLDGKTPVTDLTLVAADIRILKNGAISYIAMDDAQFICQHLENGVYILPVYAVDLDMLGKIEFFVLKTGCLPVKKSYEVRKAHSVTINSVVNGTATISPVSPIFDGENTLLTMTPSNGYYLTALTLDGRDVYSQVLPESGGEGIRYFTLQNVAGPHAFVVTFDVIPQP